MSTNPLKNWIELTDPNFCFGNPPLTWTIHSNHNNQQVLAMYRQNTHGILLQNSSTGLGLFWDDFQKKNPSDTWTHPPTYIVISDLWRNFLFAKLI